MSRKETKGQKRPFVRIVGVKEGRHEEGERFPLSLLKTVVWLFLLLRDVPHAQYLNKPPPPPFSAKVGFSPQK